MLEKLQNALLETASPDRAVQMKRFFKTGKGEYGEGDIFIGLSNPQLRALAKEYKTLPLGDLQELLDSEVHEFRFVALLIMVEQFEKDKHGEKKKSLFDLYMKNTHRINNWDLVDCSCRDIVGAYLFDKDRTLLDKMANTNHLWTQRIAIVSTWYFIREKQFDDTFRIAETLLPHRHDLIHKAVGWMLREVWKKGEAKKVEDFLEKHIRCVPRTTLRYAIEKMEKSKRKDFLTK